MADITMCFNGVMCPRHKQCDRYTTLASDWQSYAYFYKYDKDEECNKFVPNGLEPEDKNNETIS